MHDLDTDAGRLDEIGLEAFLTAYRARSVLRFLTCGSVDDGKSTLIGRMLHDARLVFDDHLAALEKDSARYGTTGEALDMALLVDGLKAEREQGITIDVAWRYFSTARRRFIIADCPGHVQYTRNMATGASHCQLAVILVDASAGLMEQTRRHAFICSLLGIKHLILAVNKMDLVGFDEAAFEAVRRDFTAFAGRLQVDDVQFIPVSARSGDNVVHRSERMPWYTGATLLGALETVHIANHENLIDLRLPIQRALRPSADFRGFAGTLAAGILRVGAEVVALPSGQRSKVASIYTPEGPVDAPPVEMAQAPQAVVITLEDELDLTRGDMIAGAHNTPHLDQRLEAMVVWMNERPLAPGGRYLLKHTTQTVPAAVSQIRYAVDMGSLRRKPTGALALNDIGRVAITTDSPLAWDPYSRNRTTGAFILIDRLTCATVAAGMLVDRPSATRGGQDQADRWLHLTGPEAPAAARLVAEGLRRWGRPCQVISPALLAADLNRDLSADPTGPEATRRALAVARLIHEAGLTVIVAGFEDMSPPVAPLARAVEGSPDAAAEALLQHLDGAAQ